MPKSKSAAGANAPAAKKPKMVGKQKSKLYAMPEKIAEGTVLTDLSKGQWRIGPSIGTGGFGEIYSACKVGEKNYDYVVKCEPHGNGPLFVEMHFYMRNAKLEDIKGFQKQRGLKSLGMPYMLGNGSADINGQKHRFIVMPRYGTDVAKHFVANGKRLPEGTAYRLALQMLDVYEFVHSCGYVHADLKGANILLGHGKAGLSQAYLVDYGLASHFTTKEFKPDPKKMHNGTIEYTSRDAHQGVPTMRADLEILGYNLIEWLGVQLPWVKDNILATAVKVQKAKEEFMANVSGSLKKIFPKGVPDALSEFMGYVAKMKYNDNPNYEHCRKIFLNALKSLKIAHSGDLNFNLKSSNVDKLSPPTTSAKAKAMAKSRLKQAVMEQVDSSDDEVICASDDDDNDVVLIDKKTSKKKTNASPTAKPLKTRVKSPARKVLASKFNQKSPSPSPLKHKQKSPAGRNTSPNKLKNSPTPLKHKRTSPAAKSPTPKKRTESSNKMSSSSSASRAQRSTPVAAKANINFSPAISVSGSNRHGKTIINDSLTPNPRAGKTYEFNFELDVSMDANVVVNVKRKKKPLIVHHSNDSPKTSSSTSSRKATNDDSPVTRVKVRKLASADDVESSPRTPAVTVKKTKRYVSPR